MLFYLEIIQFTDVYIFDIIIIYKCNIVNSIVLIQYEYNIIGIIGIILYL